jgi:hypothetical protein
MPDGLLNNPIAQEPVTNGVSLGLNGLESDLALISHQSMQHRFPVSAEIRFRPGVTP